MKNRKICYVTGTRAEYGLMRHTLEVISKEFDLSLIVTGMHLCPEFGYTINEIEKEGFKIDKKVDMLLATDTGGTMAKSLGLAVIGITQALEDIKPDMLLITGDRGEALAAAIAGAHLNIPIIHIHGGDQGDDGAHIDDQIRHSITKFSHIHLVATEKSAERIIKMGEEPWRVHIVTAPGLDEIFSEELYSKEYIEKKHHLDLDKPLILVVQHPTLTQIDMAADQIRETLEALKEINEQTILIYPNADAGGRRMIKVIQEYEKYDFLQTYKSLHRKDYLSLMKYTSVMVGNSSSGTIEAPTFKLPVVNIGIRESSREHAGNKIFVKPTRNEIRQAIKKALFDENFKKLVRKCKSPYGDGKASQRILTVLNTIKNTKKLLRKRLTY
jgi:UDP-N-acetylglucosamine 2-epimerase (non-hydrolysing)/GDP/UDP-N,N'-diacetylbacillosamine 2-epimerase (hydrolysing)